MAALLLTRQNAEKHRNALLSKMGHKDRPCTSVVQNALKTNWICFFLSSCSKWKLWISPLWTLNLPAPDQESLPGNWPWHFWSCVAIREAAAPGGLTPAHVWCVLCLVHQQPPWAESQCLLCDQKGQRLCCCTWPLGKHDWTSTEPKPHFAKAICMVNCFIVSIKKCSQAFNVSHPQPLCVINFPL